MAILMGGSGSTGSSMLRRVFNRHPAVFSAAELNFFNKEQIFENWNLAKHRLLSSRFFRLTTKGWFAYRGTYLLHEDYGWNRAELKELISSSSTLRQFVDAFFARPLAKHSATIWLEKTPSNAYSFTRFLEYFDDGLVIHTARNPLDSVASLVKRGFAPIYASGLWVYNTATAMNAESSDRYFLVRYEDLVTNPEKQVDTLLKTLGLDFEPTMLDGEGNPEGKYTGSKTWLNRPDGKISTSSMGRFNKLDKEKQEEIITALTLFGIADRHVRARGLQYRCCEDICKKLGYQFTPEIYPRYIAKIRSDMRKDYIYRSLRLFATGWRNFPGKIRKSDDLSVSTT